MRRTMDELSRVLLRYGFFVTDDSTTTDDGEKRVRVIEYDGALYCHRMENGEVVEIAEIERRANK